MPKYTVESQVASVVFENIDGPEEQMQFKVKVLKDKKEIAHIDQRYSVSIPDTEMRKDIGEKVTAIAIEDYELEKRTELEERAVALEAVFKHWELDLP